MKIMKYRCAFILLISWALLFSGCSYKEEFRPKTREKKTIHYTQLGLVIPNQKVLIQNNIDTSVMSGMKHGADYCTNILPPDFLSAAIMLACLPFGAIYGAVAGHEESIDLEKLIKDQGNIQIRLEATELYNRLQEVISNYTQENGLHISAVVSPENNQTVDYSQIASKGIDSIIEFKIDKIELDEKSLGNIPVGIYLQVSGKLTKVSDSETFITDRKEIKSKIHTYEDWVKNDFELLNKEFNRMLEIAAKSIIDELLFLYYPTLRKELPERTAPYYVLNAYYPEVLFHMFSSAIVRGSKHMFTEILEQQPVLSWESFPWEYDEIPKERFSDISYDLEIYDFQSDTLVYERKGLKENRHKVEIVLKKNTKYLWRVRSRFLLENKIRLTEWSGVYNRNIFNVDVPAWKFGTNESDTYLGPRTLDLKKHFSYAFIIEDD